MTHALGDPDHRSWSANDQPASGFQGGDRRGEVHPVALDRKQHR